MPRYVHLDPNVLDRINLPLIKLCGRWVRPLGRPRDEVGPILSLPVRPGTPPRIRRMLRQALSLLRRGAPDARLRRVLLAVARENGVAPQRLREWFEDALVGPTPKNQIRRAVARFRQGLAPSIEGR